MLKTVECFFFNYLNIFNAENYVGRDSLKTWQDSNHPWLELSDVCVRTTQNIRITVIPFYIGLKVNKKNLKKIFFFSNYFIIKLNLLLF